MERLIRDGRERADQLVFDLPVFHVRVSDGISLSVHLARPRGAFRNWFSYFYSKGSLELPVCLGQWVAYASEVEGLVPAEG